MSFKIQQQCRICMQFDELMTDIFSGVMETENGELKSVFEAFEEVTGVTASEDDEITSLICLICINRLKDAVNLRLLADLSLRKFISMKHFYPEEPSETFNNSIETADVASDEVKYNLSGIKDYHPEDQNLVAFNVDDSSSSLNDRTPEEGNNDDKDSVIIIPEDEEDSHVCYFCRSSFNCKESLDVHLSVHLRENKKAPKNHELKTLKGLNNYHKQLATSDKEKSLFKCSSCGKEFFSSTSLYHHERLHALTPIFCTICSRSFLRQSDYTRHMLTHSSERPFGCHLCPKSYKRRDHLKIHIRVHTNEKPYTCPQCSRAFISSGDMRRHSKTHEKT